MFSDKVVLVTGGGSGFGEATAWRFARDGAHVVVADVDEARAKGVTKALADAGHSALALQVDVRDSKEVAAMIEATESAFGGLDVLINNAGLISRNGLRSRRWWRPTSI